MVLEIVFFAQTMPTATEFLLTQQFAVAIQTTPGNISQLETMAAVIVLRIAVLAILPLTFWWVLFATTALKPP